MLFKTWSKGTKYLGHNKALAWESRGFAIKKEDVPILTHPLQLVFDIQSVVCPGVSTHALRPICHLCHPSAITFPVDSQVVDSWWQRWQRFLNFHLLQVFLPLSLREFWSDKGIRLPDPFLDLQIIQLLIIDVAPVFFVPMPGRCHCGEMFP